MELVCPPCVYVDFVWVLWIPPTAQKHELSSSRGSKLLLGVRVNAVYVCLVIDGQPIQGGFPAFSLCGFERGSSTLSQHQLVQSRKNKGWMDAQEG